MNVIRYLIYILPITIILAFRIILRELRLVIIVYVLLNFSKFCLILQLFLLCFN